MRNPLGAIIQCTDDVVAAFEAVEADLSSSARGAVQQGLEAAETISYCGQHQKRIIDDILTLSKLDSDLLNITPVVANPANVAREALKIFEAQFRALGVTSQLNLSQEYKRLKIENAMFDPNRIIQVLVNLIANALKVRSKLYRSMQAFLIETSLPNLLRRSKSQ